MDCDGLDVVCDELVKDFGDDLNEFLLLSVHDRVPHRVDDVIYRSADCASAHLEINSTKMLKCDFKSWRNRAQSWPCDSMNSGPVLYK